MYRVRVKRGDRKTRVSKGIIFGKPKNHGINKMKSTRNLRSIAEERAGRKLGALRVMNSYWVGQDAVNKWYVWVCVAICRVLRLSCPGSVVGWFPRYFMAVPVVQFH